MKHRITDIQIAGIDTNDYPDFCDAYIASALCPRSRFIPKFLLKAFPVLYRELTDAELDRLNDDSSFVYEQVTKSLY